MADDNRRVERQERGQAAMTPEQIERLLREAVADAQEFDDRLKRVFSLPGESVPLRRK